MAQAEAPLAKRPRECYMLLCCCDSTRNFPSQKRNLCALASSLRWSKVSVCENCSGLSLLTEVEVIAEAMQMSESPLEVA